MRNQIIATLVGGLIIFIWQFISWGLVNIHQSETQYTPNQDAILEHLGTLDLEEGHYFMPTVPPGSSAEEMEALQERATGQPWAMVSYHKSFEMSMGMNMARGMAVDLLAAFLLVWVLLKFQDLTFGTALIASLAVGFIGYLTIPYLNTIWFETNSLSYLIDVLVQWGLVGAWLGWFLTRGD